MSGRDLPILTGHERAIRILMAHHCVCDTLSAGSPNALAGAHTFEDDEV